MILLNLQNNPMKTMKTITRKFRSLTSFVQQYCTTALPFKSKMILLNLQNNPMKTMKTITRKFRSLTSFVQQYCTTALSTTPHLKWHFNNVTPFSFNKLAGFKIPFATLSITPQVSVAKEYGDPTIYFHPTPEEMVEAFLPEFGLAFGVVALMAAAAYEISLGRDLKELALVYWHYSCYILIFICVIFEARVLGGLVLAAPAFGNYVYISAGLTTAKLLVSIAGFLILLTAENYIREHRRHCLEFPFLMLISIFFLLVLTSANHLATIFFSVAGFSLPLYVLIHLDAHDGASREASLKYFYLSTLSAGLILFGLLLIYAILEGQVSYSQIRDLTDPETFPRAKVVSIVGVGASFITLGFLFKLSAFPGHLWAVEVYEGAPIPVTAFFLLPVKIAVFTAFLRLLNTAFLHQSHIWLPCVTTAAVLSLVWGAYAAVQSRKTLRFLGYASINQIGLLLCGVVAGTTEALRASFFYLILYAAMTLGFLVVFAFLRRPDGRPYMALSDFRGLCRTEPLTCWSLSIVLFAMAGIPPLAGFYGKFFIISAIAAKGLYLLAAIVLAVSVTTAYYYLRIIKIFWFEEDIAIKKPIVLLEREHRVLLSFLDSMLWSLGILSPVLLPLLDKTAFTLQLCG